MAGLTLASPSAERRPAWSPWRETWRRYRRHKLAVVSAVLLLVLIVAVVFGPFVWRVSINDIDFNARLEGPSLAHPFGTDDLGQDILARMIYGGRISFLSLREKEFVEAARALGASPVRQVVRHILPNAVGPVIIAGTIDVAAAIIAESTLSFLGLGFPPDTPTWGRLLFDAKDFLDIAAHWALFPGGAIFVAVVAINFIGDGMRDALDARRVI